MAIKVDYESGKDQFGTLFEVGDLVEGIKDESRIIYGRDVDGNDIVGKQGKVVSTNDRYPGATLTIEDNKTKKTFQTIQWNIKLLSNYSGTMTRKQINGGR